MSLRSSLRGTTGRLVRGDALLRPPQRCCYYPADSHRLSASREPPASPPEASGCPAPACRWCHRASRSCGAAFPSPALGSASSRLLGWALQQRRDLLRAHPRLCVVSLLFRLPKQIEHDTKASVPPRALAVARNGGATWSRGQRMPGLWRWQRRLRSARTGETGSALCAASRVRAAPDVRLPARCATRPRCQTRPRTRETRPGPPSSANGDFSLISEFARKCSRTHSMLGAGLAEQGH